LVPLRGPIKLAILAPRPHITVMARLGAWTDPRPQGLYLPPLARRAAQGPARQRQSAYERAAGGHLPAACL